MFFRPRNPQLREQDGAGTHTAYCLTFCCRLYFSIDTFVDFLDITIISVQYVEFRLYVFSDILITSNLFAKNSRSTSYVRLQICYFWLMFSSK